MSKSSAGTGLGLALDRRAPALSLAGAGRQGRDLLAVEEHGLVVLACVIVEDVCQTALATILPREIPHRSAASERCRTYSAW